MTKKYQTTEFDTSALAVPEQVTVAMNEIAADMREGCSRWRSVMERMLAGVSTRRYPVALEPVGDQVTAESKSTSKSAVSRKFVAALQRGIRCTFG